MLHRSLLKASLALSGLLAGLVVSVATAPPAGAEEIYPRDADGVFAIEGHGWGHGHGMSQWGAQGGASLGRTSDQITGFYYPGTAKTVLSNAPIRVLLQADTGGDTQVYPGSGLAVTDLASGAKATLPTGVERWRTVVDSAGLHLQNYKSGAWHAWTLLGRSTLAGPVEFGGPTFVRPIFPNGSSRDYRGTIRSVKTSSTTVATVNALPMESYLMGVVPRESSSSWQAAALQSQAIAARSYSSYKREHVSSTAFYDICDTTQCQVYGGAATWSGSTRTALEPASTNEAIKATAGVIRTYQGKAIFSEYSSSNGGWSTDGGVPYLKAQRDDWDGAVGNSVHAWTATLTAAQLERRYPAVGTLRRIRVTQRDGNGEWGGRVKQVVLEGVNSSGAATSVATTGAGVYNANPWPASSNGLRSSWWHVAAATSSTIASQSTAPTLVRSPGVSTGTLTVTLRNSGSTTWSTSGLHLAVASPPGQADPLVGGSATPGVYTGTASSIAPDATAAFRFPLTGDGVAAGVHGRSYRLRNGTGALFGTTVSWQVSVQNPVLTAAIATRPTSTTAAPAPAPNAVFADGKTVVVPINGSTDVRISARNTGNVSWPATTGTTPSPVALGTSGPRNRTSASAGPTWVSPSRPARLGGSAAVGPGALGTFDLTLNGNGKPVGVSSEAFEPLWESRRWFDGASIPLTVVRVDPAAARLAAVDSLPASSLALTNAPTGATTLRLRLRNLGGQPWTLSEEALRATETPLSTSAWTTSTTPPKLAGNVSRPGQSQVHPGEVGEWRVPLSAFRKAAGTYTLALQPVGPGEVLYGPRMTFTVKVTKAVFSGTLVRVSPRVNVPRNGAATAYIDVKNTGNVGWALSSAVRSAALTSGGSPSRFTSWISATRPGGIRSNVTKPGTTVVNPGEVARFVIVLAGNGRTPGARSEPFGALWESWTRIAGLRATISYVVI